MDYFYSLCAVLALTTAFSAILSKKKKFRALSLLNSEQEKQTWREKAAGFYERFFSTRVRVKSNRIEEIQLLIDSVGWKVTPEQLLIQQVMYSSTALTACLLYSVLAESIYFVGVGFVLAAYFFRYPLRKLEKEMALKQKRVRQELPDFADQLILFLSSGLIPYQAIKSAALHAPPSLSLDAHRLASDLDVFSQAEALDRFAKHLGVREATRLVRGLKHAMEIDRESARPTLERLSQNMRKLREQNMRALIKEKPILIDRITMGLFILVLSVPLCIAALSLIEIITSMG